MTLRQQAVAVPDHLDEALANPMSVRPGRIIYFDASRGVYERVQTQIALGVLLDDQEQQ